MTAQERALVVGGTGMLRPAVGELLERGHDVGVVARRPLRAAPNHATPGRFTAVAADWHDPVGLAGNVASSLGREVSIAVLWVHDPHRSRVMEQLRDVLAPDAVILHVWGSAARDPRELVEEQSRDGAYSIRHVVLGYHRDGEVSRWLTDQEISAATIRALDEEIPFSIAGRIDPWAERP